MEPKPFNFQIRLAGLALRVVASLALFWIGHTLTTQSQHFEPTAPLAQID